MFCTTIHRYPIFSTRYSVMCKVYNGYCGTSEIEHGLCACTVDNPLAKARGLSLRTGAQTMLYLSHIVCQPLQVVHTCMSVICFHPELGHNFLESFLATYGFARFFDKDSPRWRACFLNSVFDYSPLRNSKNFQILDVRRCSEVQKFCAS